MLVEMEGMPQNDLDSCMGDLLVGRIIMIPILVHLFIGANVFSLLELLMNVLIEILINVLAEILMNILVDIIEEINCKQNSLRKKNFIILRKLTNNKDFDFVFFTFRTTPCSRASPARRPTPTARRAPARSSEAVARIRHV